MPWDFKQTIKYKVLFRGGQLSRKLFAALVKYRNFGLLPASGTRQCSPLFVFCIGIASTLSFFSFTLSWYFSPRSKDPVFSPRWLIRSSLLKPDFFFFLQLGKSPKIRGSH